MMVLLPIAIAFQVQVGVTVGSDSAQKAREKQQRAEIEAEFEAGAPPRRPQTFHRIPLTDALRASAFKDAAAKRSAAPRTRRAAQAGLGARELRRDHVSARLRRARLQGIRSRPARDARGGGVARAMGEGPRRARGREGEPRRRADRRVGRQRKRRQRKQQRREHPGDVADSVLSRPQRSLDRRRAGPVGSGRNAIRAPHRRRRRGVLHVPDRRLGDHDAAGRQAHRAARAEDRGAVAEVEPERRVVLVRRGNRAPRARRVPDLDADGRVDRGQGRERGAARRTARPATARARKTAALDSIAKAAPPAAAVQGRRAGRGAVRIRANGEPRRRTAGPG